MSENDATDTDTTDEAAETWRVWREHGDCGWETTANSQQAAGGELWGHSLATTHHETYREIVNG